MTKTLVLIGHPDIADSSSQQFLLSSGQALTSAKFVNLQAEYDKNQGQFNIEQQQILLLNAERIIFQFPLYWYSPPAIVKIWLDQVLENRHDNPKLIKSLSGKDLGLVVIADVKASHYQAGARIGRSLSELLSPFEAIAKYFQMNYLPLFPLHQFSYLLEEEKMYLMYQYACYLDTGNPYSRRIFQGYLENKLQKLDSHQITLDEADQFVFDMWLTEFSHRHEEISELFQLSEED